jgi:outer membrane protein insertion porin family
VKRTSSLLRFGYVALLSAALVLGFASFQTAFAAQTSAQQIPPQLMTRKLDRVEIVGAKAISQSELEANLDIGPGDLFDRGKVSRSADNITSLYRNRGYEKMRIGARIRQEKNEHGIPELILEYRIDEGKPTLLSMIDLAPVQLRDESALRYWNRIEGDLQSKIGLNPGDLYDQTKIANAKRTLEESLTSNEFIGAKVSDIVVTAGGEPASLKASKPEAERWVNVEFRVSLGDRVTFGFRGNSVVPRARLLSLIEEQRVIGLGRDYIESIRSHLEDEYRSLGYAHVSISSYVFEKPEHHERHVTYVIQEGRRVSIEHLQFDGNTVFANDELKEQFYKRASEVVSHGYYVEKDVQKAAEALVDWMKSKGYLSAKLLTISHEYPLKPLKTDTGRYVDISVYLYEGEQSLVRNVNFQGNHALSKKEIESVLGIAEGQPLNLFAFSAGLETLKARYRNRGYLSARILNEGTDRVVTYFDDNRSADIFVDIAEGPQYKVTGIQIEGLTRTKEYVVQREFLFRQGEVLEEPELLGTEARLHRLGIFSGVTVRALDDPERSDGKIVRVSLQEGTPGIIAGGAGLRNDLGLRVFGQTGYSNLWGEDHTISLNVAANRRFQDFRFIEYEAQLAYIWPYFAFGETAFRPTATLTGTEYHNFDAVTAALALTWERKLFDRVVGDFTYSLERVIQFNAKIDTDNQGIRIGAITPAIRYDHRDNPLNPTSGFFASLSYELAEPWLLSQQAPVPIGYGRALLRSDFFWPVTSDINWYFSFRTGYEQSFESAAGSSDPSAGAIPLIKQFALGGIGSLRGLKEQSLNLQSYSIKGSASYVNYRTQIDFPFAGALKFGPFLDVANLLVDDYSFYKNRLYSPGFSLRYQTPVGPVNLDFGFPLNPPPGMDTQQFFFSIGVI